MGQPYPTLSEAARVWARVAALSFGGPAGQIAVMHRILVEEKRWLGDDRFLHALNFCMLLPGPEAQQLATYIGWLMHGVRGALVAGIFFILPGIASIMALSWIYVIWGDVSWIEGAFFGLKAAVLAIVVQAVIRVGKKALKNNVMRGIAAASFVSIFLLHLPFPLIVAAAALIGYAGFRAGLPAFTPGGGHGAIGKEHVNDAATLLGAETPMPEGARGKAFKAALWAFVLWLAPVGLLVTLAGSSVFADIAVFFSKLAVLTFGGAYAVLAWVAQDAVDTYGWLQAGQMMDGLGMAETTPGPLIMVLQFVGFMGAFKAEGSLWAATLGGLLATWVTFAPCFAWIFIGAPFMETMRKNKAISAALGTVTAAVVGVILNLAVWFGIHTVIPGGVVDLRALALAVIALVAVFQFKLGMFKVLGGAVLLGMIASAI